MCLALFKSEGFPIDERILVSGYRSNPHGAGFAYSLDGELIVRKGFFSIASFLKAYSAIPDSSPALVHFRLASHGAINKHNCHPWQINDDFAMIHNGMFFDFGSDDVSDTGEFTDYVLKPMFNDLKNPREAINSKWFKYVLSSTISTKYNKVIILSRWGDYVILGENDGFWYEGIWHSNSCGMSWFTRPERQTPIVTPDDFQGIVGSENYAG